MTTNQKSKVKSQRQIKSAKPFCLLALNLALLFALCSLHSPAIAVSPAPKQSPSPIATVSAAPTNTEEEKVQEIRQAIEEQVSSIKDKIEKKAYIGTIVEITDSTLVVSNFRGKQRVRLTETTAIISAGKKEIKAKDLAVDDKIIAMGTISNNDILEAKRVIVVAQPKTTPAKRLFVAATIVAIDTKTYAITINSLDQKVVNFEVLLDKNTNIVNQADIKITLKIKDLKEGQKVIAVYFEPAEGKSPVAKSLFVLQ